jgi:hypothetical protein
MVPLPVPPGASDTGGPLPLWLILVFVLPPLAFFTVSFLRQYKRSPNKKSLTGIYVFTMLALSLTGLSAAVPNLDERFLRSVTAVFGLHLTQLLVSVLVIAVGWSAHRFKLRNKLWYGYVEVVFGAGSAIAVVSRVNFAAIEFRSLTLAQYAALVGTAYVVARGLNNITEAKERPGFEPH